MIPPRAPEAGPERGDGPGGSIAVWTRAFALLRPGFLLPSLLLLLLLFALGGCRSTPGTSRIAIADYQEMAGEMSQSLRQSEAINERSPDDEPWVVSFHKVLNLSSEIMTQSEQWGIVAMVRGAQPINSLWDDKRIAFVIPAQYAIDQRGTLDAERASKGFGTERGVTHTITATFRSVTNATGDGRTDQYACEFQMIDLRSNEPVWLDTFEFKRTAAGNVRD